MASALTLGRMTVQSSLGEALRAEIDITSMTPEEASSLRTAVAQQDAFRAAGVEYNAVLAGAQVSLKRRQDGRSYFLVQGERSVSEPFLDLILDFAWSGGRLQRSYTLLIDPPARQALPPAPAIQPTAPALSPAPVVVATPIAPSAPAVRVQPPSDPAPERAPSRKVPTAASAGDTYKVRAGDTLSRIASGHIPAGVSLDQMLVGLFRGNPDAFVGNNMNRLKAGAVLTIPDASRAGSVSSAEARQIIQAHSADFAGFRSRLADAAPAIKASEPPRQAVGKVSAAVQEPASTKAKSPDQLKLSTPTVKSAAVEEKLSKEAERKAAEARVQELKRNVEELKGLKSGMAAAPAAPVAASAPAPSKPAVPVATPAPAAVPSVPAAVVPAPVVVAPPMASAPGSVPAIASAPQPVASAPVVAAAASRPAAPVAPPVPAAAEEGEGFLDGLMSNPFVLPGAVGLVALLAGLGFMRLRRRHPESSGETSFIESKLQPDSFFGVSGGQRVDTRDGGASSSSSSLSYSLSQLDAIGDVDPVAEADVYLAYGRDLQAEEILKEALRTDPERLAIRVKLLEVYAKRGDLRNLEAYGRQLQELTGGVGEDWLKAQELGRQVDPENPLYLDISQVGAVDIDTSPEPPPDLMPEPDDAGYGADEPAISSYGHAAAPSAAPQPLGAPLDAGDSEAQFDLDIDLDAASKLTGLESTRPISTLSTGAGEFGSSSDFNFNTDSPSELGSLDLGSTDLGGLELEETGMRPLPDLDLGFEHSAPAPSAPAAAPVDFDFGDLSLDLDAPAEAGGMNMSEGGGHSLSFDAPASTFEGDPLLRKIELADEFLLIGDAEGARDLLEEVLSKGSPELRNRAQSMLNELG